MKVTEQSAARAWRLAALLGGDRARALRIARAALSAPGAARLPPDRIDRLVVLRSREVGVGAAKARVGLLTSMRRAHRRARGRDTNTSAARRSNHLFAGRAAATAHALGELEQQPREAWALAHVLGFGMLEISRAMDCSKTAASRHLEHAESSMRRRLGDDHEAALDALRSAAVALSPPAELRLAGVNPRLRRGGRALLWLVVVALLVAGAVYLAHLMGYGPWAADAAETPPASDAVGSTQ